MKVNKKRLAEIFNVDPRTIERWQSQGLPCASKGSKGIESVFDTAMAIQWYAQRETDIENEKLRKELDDLRAAAESDLQPGTIDYERYRLTKAQADAQELKNAREDGVVLETELFTFILQRVAQEISGILVRVPLTLQRKYAEGGYVGGAGSPAQMRRAEGINFNQNNHVVIQNDGTNGLPGPQMMKAVYDMARKGARDEIQAQMRDGGLFSGGG
ncbi:hypothetical protein DFZ61_18570 [Escherichia coli]|nr:hypothetical protein [Escherichia coli]